MTIGGRPRSGPESGLPTELVDAFRPGLPGLAEEIIEAIRTEVGAYARPLTGEFGRGVRTGVERALTRFLEIVEDPSRQSPRARRIYVDLGRGEFREGRSLDALLAAYRVGARIAWRRAAQAGSAAGLEPEVLFDIGERIFAYIDELSSASAEGYALEQSAAAGERERRTRELVTTLLADPPPSEQALRAAGAPVGWRPPATVAGVVLSGERPGELASALGAGSIAAVVADEETVGFVGDPAGPGARERLQRGLAGRAAVVGPTAPLARSAWSAAVARRGVEARRNGALAGVAEDASLFCDDRLLELTLHADPELAGALARRALEPLEELPARSRERLRETLATWLDRQGGIEATAAALGVHPQTVRYRLGQLRDRLGATLDDPEGRLALQVALRVREGPRGRP
jgi:hypothetical protein